MIEPLFTTKQVAELVNLSPQTIRERVRKGICPCVNPERGTHYRFRPQEIYAWIDRGMKPDLPKPLSKRRYGRRKKVLQTTYL